MTIKNIKKVCSILRNSLTAADPRLSSVFVEVIMDVETGELETFEHSDAYSRMVLPDYKIHVNTYGYATKMTTIREDAERALMSYNMHKELYR